MGEKADAVGTGVERVPWKNNFHFVLSCIGYAVGFGSLWRFPSLAYENGGGAFLIPYLICSFVVGFPLIYLEMSLGQFARAGPAVLYGRIRPAFQGIGWAMAGVSLMVSIYYNLINAWVLVYLAVVCTGQTYRWASCRNEFNTEYCSSPFEDEACGQELGANDITGGAFLFNRTCHWSNETDVFQLRNKLFAALPAVGPAEEFFEHYVLEKSESMEILGGISWKLVAALAISWICCCIILIKGVPTIGAISTVTSTLPFIILCILCVRGLTLDGAINGLDYYLLKPDLTVIYKPETWRAAATQVMYTLAIAFGGLISLSSFNDHNHNCFRDALWVTIADGVMSALSGTVVFSVLGFMAKQLNVPISRVVQSGTSLAFIAYPEAMSRMPLPWLWAFLFFFMLFLLGLPSQLGMVEVMTTAIHDQCSRLRKFRIPIAIGLCTLLFSCGLIMTTRAGIFYFNLFDSYSASFSLMFLAMTELILVTYIYGLPNYILDLQVMLGKPRTRLAKIFGPSGWFVRIVWKVIAPIELIVIFVFVFITQVATRMTYGKDERKYEYPGWSIALGWVISLLPLFALPAFLFYNYKRFKRQGRDIKELMRLQPKWTSYERNKRLESSQANGHRIHVVPTEEVIRGTVFDDLHRTEL